MSDLAGNMIFIIAILLLARRGIDFCTLAEKIKQIADKLDAYGGTPSSEKQQKANLKWGRNAKTTCAQIALLNKFRQYPTVMPLTLTLFVFASVGYGTLYQDSSSVELMSGIIIRLDSIVIGVVGMLVSIIYALSSYLIELIKRKVK